ncbi:hypothetical protein ZOSMA_107G00870 [Zostera marina]|uniref:Uncharacterized protein n=1 Tax=Zostera marina TaxID=29655 RepID=A0A0K9Q4I1_ZOSMR|nr:hypothetical protein ZOSMA_107G00870 [Zostera marina]
MSTSKSKLISPSPSSPLSLRQFRQQAIPTSLFSESRASYGRGSDIMLKSPTASVSLSVFLNRKLATNNILGRGSVKDKKTCFASIGGIQRVGGGNYEGGPLDRDIFQKLNSFRKEEDRKDLNVLKEPSQLELENNKQDNCKSGSKKRGNPFTDKSIDRPSSSKYLHVLGDDPKPMWNAIKKKKVERKREPIYNHYANGSGLWGCDREGVDTEEVGCNETWEGMGSTTLGGLEWH